MKNPASHTQLRFIIILYAFFAFHIGYGQELIVDTCPNPNGGQRAYNSVKFFLTLSDMLDERNETGTTTESVSQIRSVSEESVCAKLNDIVRGNPKYKRVDDTLDQKRTKYYYRTDNFYYIFWDRKPQYDNIPNTGPKTLFIVVSKDYKKIWQYYF